MHPQVYTSHQFSNISTGYPSKLVFFTKLPASVSMPSITLLLLIFLISCICTLPPDPFAPVLTPARRKVIVPSLILALLSGTHCHFTSEMVRFSTLLSPLSKPTSSTFKILISSVPFGVCVCVCACVCMRACVCAHMHAHTHACMYCLCELILLYTYVLLIFVYILTHSPI